MTLGQMHVDWLIAGLGNPGRQYELTRHNIGWLVCAELCNRFKQSFSPAKGDYVQAALRIRGKSVLVILPTTYMNNSGTAIKHAVSQYKLTPSNVMIVVDEFNFPVGRVHLKQGGSDGGHNGTHSVISELGTDRFWRLRCGIDKNFGMGELVDYVLREFDSTERDGRDRMIARAADAIELVMSAGVARAVSAINSDKDPLIETKK